jgi:hypothetical protein
MKTAAVISILALVVTLGFVSCEKQQTQRQIERHLKSEKWKITLFEESGMDETANFSGYKFTFENFLVSRVSLPVCHGLPFSEL